MQRIEVTISPEGETKVEAVGCAGPGCQQLTAAIERSIGRTTTDVKKPEFTRAKGQGNQQTTGAQ